MEVHHHSHAAHGKKNWKAYFWEFLMLFLAVFCGFLAENIREHSVERQREKEYIHSLIADLKSDQEVLSKHIVHVKTGISMMDSMITILNTPSTINNNTGELYFFARLAPRLIPLSTNNRTFEQLKNSGNFRLIGDINTSNKIMTYYEKFPLVHLLQSINETEFTEYKKVAAKVFNPAVLLKMEGRGDEIIRTTDNPSLRSSDNELLQELSVFSVYMHGTKKGMLRIDEDLKISGAALIEYLQKRISPRINNYYDKRTNHTISDLPHCRFWLCFSLQLFETITVFKKSFIMKTLLFFLSMLLFMDSVNAQKTVLLAKTLIDGTGKIISNSAVVIDSNKIVAVTTRDNIPAGAVIINLGDYTLLPGLIDMHVHPNLTTDDYQVDHLKGSSASKALMGLKNVRDLLAAGWTTLRVAGDGDVGYANMEIKKAINKGLFIGPHIYGAAHYISVTGGGGDINFLSPEQKIIPDGLIADGPEEIRKVVRNEIKYGSDWIKLLVTGAFMTAGDNPNNVHFSPEELKVAVEEAARRDVPVMAHAHAAEGIKMAVKAGVRTIEHGSFIDEEAMDLMIKYGTRLIPTFSVHLYFDETMGNNASLQKAFELGRKTKETMYTNMRLAFKKGVKFGLGTDDVGWPANYSAREFTEYVKIGMTPMQAILCATKINAEILKKENEIGTVEKSKLADIIAVKGDPLKDISELQRVKFVMIGGKIIKNEK